ncbi:MAG: succinate dehydrogenase/fumarate reductase iron-sulfur subunit [Nitrososphaerota archaeon]|nr:succinate dehydrogenase/fumarate reductase iron-sulfur subunit [Nitrososphaerota archaeon]
MSKAVRLRVFRGTGNDPTTFRYDTFDVPAEEGMVVLNAIHYVQSRLDSSLTARWNCKAGRCGSCAVEINGTPHLMCKTSLGMYDGEVTVEPMKAFPLIRDLVTDTTASRDTAGAIPPFTPRSVSKRPWLFYQGDVERSRELRKCIECFLCQDACHAIREHAADYIGPRWVAKAASFDMHPMDGSNRSKFLREEGGLEYCNVTKCCQEVCPEHIAITDDAIIPEKERVVDEHYDPLVWIYRKLKKRR